MKIFFEGNRPDALGLNKIVFSKPAIQAQKRPDGE
jgi:hypothetical protein